MMWISRDQVLRGALFTGFLSMSVNLPAQSPPAGVEPAMGTAEANVMFFSAAQAGPISGEAGAMLGGTAMEDHVVVLGPMGMMGGGVVKGVPYSATATTEMVQRLADGNRIRHGNSSTTYRDGEGRTRRDQSLPAIGPFAGASGPSLSFINDPVAKVTYVLNHTEKTARKMPAPQWMQGHDAGGGTAAAMPAFPPMHAPGAAGAGARVRVFARRIERAPGSSSALPSPPTNLRREDLGKKLIEGVEVEGTRTTFTIPAGSIGNEQAIDVTTEEWRSPVLQVLISSKTTDPRVGENTFQLSNISRNEPDASLFQVPADYKLLENGPAVFNLAVPPPEQR